MKPADRQAWIVEYIASQPGGVRHFDTLNAAFVDAYIDATGASWKPTALPNSAFLCPRLAADLRALYDAGTLTRQAIGMSPGDAAMGFPKWVYSYRLAAPAPAP